MGSGPSYEEEYHEAQRNYEHQKEIGFRLEENISNLKDRIKD